jgi:type II secretory pathway component PulC
MDVLGFENGDGLISIMGLSMTSPDQALEAYVKARNAPVIPVVVRRRGTDLTLEYRIVTQ